MSPRAPKSKAPIKSKAAGSGACAHVALLRGINVGGKHIVPMADLVKMFQKAGATDVRTYIQSGNVVFAAPRAAAKHIADAVAKLIARKFGFEPVIIVCTGKKLVEVAARNPFLKSESDHRLLNVGFLAHEPDAKSIARLDPKRSPGDRFAIVGRVLYLHLPNGVGKTKLTSAYLDATLCTTCTVRNWRTVLTLAEMARGDA